jgi:hypothetical protein
MLLSWSKSLGEPKTLLYFLYIYVYKKNVFSISTLNLLIASALRATRECRVRGVSLVGGRIWWGQERRFWSSGFWVRRARRPKNCPKSRKCHFSLKNVYHYRHNRLICAYLQGQTSATSSMPHVCWRNTCPAHQSAAVSAPYFPRHRVLHRVFCLLLSSPSAIGIALPPSFQRPSYQPLPPPSRKPFATVFGIHWHGFLTMHGQLTGDETD